MHNALNDDETMLVATVCELVDKEVRPTVREVKHANEYPEAWIDQTKRIGETSAASAVPTRRYG
jgi:alkylation response protein AidB-like acyl-CoA dehydrogenase